VLANKLVVLSTGAWLLPFWRELPAMSDNCDADKADGSAGVLLSTDQGVSWHAHGAIYDSRTFLIEVCVGGGERERVRERERERE
jgi:hypothetical protein